MNKRHYLNLAARARDAETLQALHQDAMLDPSLREADRNEICEAIKRRFAQLNAGRVEAKNSVAWEGGFGSF
jgi:hypothetical protein